LLRAMASPSAPSALAAPPAPRSQAATGVLLVLLSTLSFTIMSVAVNQIGSDMPTLQTTTYRFWAQLLLTLLLIPVLRRGKLRERQTWFGLPGNNLKLLARGAWGIGGLSCFFATLQNLPLADATAIVYLNVPLTALFSRFLLNEPYKVPDAVAGLLAMVGVVFVAQPPALFGGDAVPAPLWAVGLALVGSVCSAMAYVSIRIIGPKEDFLVIVLWFSVLGSFVVPVLCVSIQGFVTPPNTRIVLLEAAAGIFGWLGQLSLNAGLARAPAGPAITMRYADIPVAVVIQTALTGRLPNAFKLMGCALVMSTLFAVLWKQLRKKALPAVPLAAKDGVAAAWATEAAETDWSSPKPYLALELR
jgi:drug/metabolite transporter (DMT)-like permease